jgi:hypothetical protein
LTVARIQPPPGAPANASLSVVGDLTTSSDVNFFKFTTNALNPNGVTIQLNTSNQSLLAGQISVYNSAQQLIATRAATGPGQDLSFTLNLVGSNSTYYVKVDRPAGTQYSVGAYQLKVVFDPTAPTVAAQGSAAPLNNNGAHASLDTALALQTTAGYTANTHYKVSAIEQSATAVDVYSFQSAAPVAGQPNVMTLSVQVPGGGPAPVLTVYDSNRQTVAARVLDNGYGRYTVEVDNAQSNATYYVAFSAAPGTPAGTPYGLAISFCSQTVQPTVDDQGTLSAANNTSGGVINVSQADVRYFTLAASGAGNPAAVVQMTIYNTLGQVVATLQARRGETVSSLVLLNAGSYRVRITASTTDGSPLDPITYTLGSLSVSDPQGATMTDPNYSATGSGSTSAPPSSPSSPPSSRSSSQPSSSSSPPQTGTSSGTTSYSYSKTRYPSSSTY